MTIRFFKDQPGDILQLAIHGLGLAYSDQVPSSWVLIAGLLRRNAGTMCPCSERLLVTSTLSAIAHLVDENNLRELIEAVLDELIVGGDLIELSQVSSPDSETRSAELFCAPPGFIERNSRIYIVGIAPDDAAFLPERIRHRLQHQGSVRFLDSREFEDLSSTLTTLGLRRISADAWLTKTKPRSPQSVVESVKERMALQGVKGDLPDLSILVHAAVDRLSYAQRWQASSNESGLHVGRLPHPHGGQLWYLVDLEGGQVRASLSLPFPESAGRACDTAWELQLAIDSCNGYPAIFIDDRDSSELRLTFPIPMYARRRLMFLTLHDGCDSGGGLCFHLPAVEIAAEAEYLRTHLWFASHI